MKKYFIFSDAHGFYDELIKALKTSGFDIENPNHCIISCGDLLDRGSQPKECLEFANSLPSERKILIRGNHEDLLEASLARREFKQHDWQNGTAGTIIQIAGDPAFTERGVCRKASSDKNLNQYLDSLQDYAEIKDNIFVHGWIPCTTIKDYYIFDSEWKNGNWANARWYNGMEAWSHGVRVPDKTIYCGHWHTSYGHSKLHGEGKEWPNKRSTNPEHRVANFTPFVDDGIVALDACTAFTGRINVMCIEVSSNDE